jgi:hypothetical protein
MGIGYSLDGSLFRNRNGSFFLNGIWDQIQLKKQLLSKSQVISEKQKNGDGIEVNLYTRILFVRFILCNEENNKPNLYYEIFSTPSVYIFVNSQIGLNNVLNTQIVHFLHCLSILLSFSSKQLAFFISGLN